MRFSGFDGDDIFSCVTALNTKHLLVAIFTEIAHLVSDLFPWVPDDGRMTTAFDDDYVSFE